MSIEQWVERVKSGEEGKRDSGVYFNVEIYDDFVVKRLKTNGPRRHDLNSEEALQFIADAQTYLSKHVKSVLPCWRIGMALYMPRSPGERADRIMETWPHIKKLRDIDLKKIKELGYELTDAGRKNTFYDAATNRIYLIDFHSIKRRVKK